VQQNEVVHGFADAARLTGWSESHLRRLVHRGELAAHKNENGVYEFDRAALTGIRRDTAPITGPPVPRSPATEAGDRGRLAAKVFADLSAGKCLPDVICAHELDPALAIELHGAWLRACEADINRPTTPAVIAKLTARVDRLVGAFNELVTQLGASPLGELVAGPTCTGCDERGRTAVLVRCTACGRANEIGGCLDDNHDGKVSG